MVQRFSVALARMFVPLVVTVAVTASALGTGMLASAGHVGWRWASTVLSSTLVALLVHILAPFVQDWCIRARIAVPIDTARAYATLSAAAVAGAVPWISGHGCEIVLWISVLPFVGFAAIIDCKTHRIPSPLLYWGGAASTGAVLVCALVDGDVYSAGRAIMAGIVAASVLFSAALASGGGVGLADVRLAYPLGVLTGWYSWTTMYIGTLIGPLLLLFPIAVWHQFRRDRTSVAAAPAMVVAAVLAAMWTAHGYS